LEKARSASNGSIAVGGRLVELYLQRGEVDKALGIATETLNKNQKSLAAFGLLARVQLAKGDGSSARQTLDNMARYAGYDPVAQVEIARLQLAAGNDSGASYSLEKSLSSQPNFPPALMLRAEIEIRQREFIKAEQHINQISKIPGSNGVVASLKGDLAMAQGQFATALTAYNDALKKSDSPSMALRLYRAYAAMGDLPKGKDKSATSHAERAYSLRPTDPVVIDTLGWIMLQQGGTLDRALALLRDARLRNPNDPEIRYHLATALAKSGRRAEARDELAQALRGNVSFAGVGDARRLQAELGK
jgi:predicted Zn-dependent protease